MQVSHITYISFVSFPWRNLVSTAFTVITVITAMLLLWVVGLHVCALLITSSSTLTVWSKTFSCLYLCTNLSAPLIISNAALQPDAHYPSSFCNTSGIACSPASSSYLIAFIKHSNKYDQSLMSMNYLNIHTLIYIHIKSVVRNQHQFQTVQGNSILPNEPESMSFSEITFHSQGKFIPYTQEIPMRTD